jgi:hypothetical protein
MSHSCPPFRYNTLYLLRRGNDAPSTGNNPFQGVYNQADLRSVAGEDHHNSGESDTMSSAKYRDFDRQWAHYKNSGCLIL